MLRLGMEQKDTCSGIRKKIPVCLKCNDKISGGVTPTKVVM